MTEKIKKIKSFVLLHKKLSIFVLLIILVLGYWGYEKITSTAGEIQYITTTVEKGTIVSSVTASGQIESSNQIDLKADVSGTITYVSVKPGDKVSKGKTLLSIDNEDLKKSIRDAEISLESAKISFEKFKIQNSNENLNADLVQSYSDGFSAVSSAFLDLPDTITGIENILVQNNLSDNAARVSGKTAQSYRSTAESKYYEAENSFKETRKYYRTLNRNSPNEDIEKIITETYQTTEIISSAIKSLRDYVDFMAEDSNRSSDFSTSQDTLSTYENNITGHLNELLSAKTNIKDSKELFVNNDLDTKTELLSLKQKENSLQDLKDKLSDYYVRAPFDGVIASVTAKVGDTASGTLGSIITNQKIATLSMNEVDVSKIQLGQKATITFDAIEDLSMTGTVVEIDTLGTVSQGVVSYDVKIIFDTENDQVKSGMSVSASIITDSKTDILIVPSSAIKTSGTTKYVQVFNPPLAFPTLGAQGTTSNVLPIQITVETGITDDTNTEIISELKEGDQIISRTIISSQTTTTSTSSILGGGSTRGIGGGLGR